MDLILHSLEMLVISYLPKYRWLCRYCLLE